MNHFTEKTLTAKQQRDIEELWRATYLARVPLAVTAGNPRDFADEAVKEYIKRFIEVKK